MGHTSKRYNGIRAKIDHVKLYPVDEALRMVKENATAKFNESVDVSLNLGIDAKKSDQAVRGSIVLPQGIGKSVRVAVFAQGDRAAQAKQAGADIVGFEDLANEIKGGKLDFDVVIATPDAMRVVGGLGQILGPRGLMPNPKVGTVTQDITTAIKNAKAGQVQYRADKAGIVQRRSAVGKSQGAGRRREPGKACGRERPVPQESERIQHDGGRRTHRPVELDAAAGALA
jgi:large subunit ribosomal protein L1